SICPIARSIARERSSVITMSPSLISCQLSRTDAANSVHPEALAGGAGEDGLIVGRGKGPDKGFCQKIRRNVRNFFHAVIARVGRSRREATSSGPRQSSCGKRKRM